LGVWVRIRTKRILTPEAADLPTFHETAGRKHTPTASALTSEPVAPVQTLTDPPSKCIRTPKTLDLPITIVTRKRARAAPLLAAGGTRCAGRAG
jgi:hypothetical protein